MRKTIRRQAYYYASAAFLLLWVLYFFAVIDKPFIGLELQNVNGRWIVTYCDPKGEGYKSGIRPGDLIISINQEAPDRYRAVQIWNEAEGARSIELRRSGQIIDQFVEIPEVSRLESTLEEIPFAVLGLIFWLFGFMAWLRRPYLAQARALFWLNWFLGMAFVLAPASGRCLLYSKEMETILFAIIPILLINFLSQFSSQNNWRVKRWGLFFSTLMLVILFIGTILQSTGIIHFFSILKKIILATISIAILITIWNIGALLKSPHAKPEKNQVIILLLSLTLGFLPFVLLYALPLIFSPAPILNGEVSSWFFTVIPAACYYVIVHKYLPNSRRLLKNTLSFLVTVIIISFVVLYLHYALNFSKNLNIVAYLLTISLFGLYSILFITIRLLVSKLLNKYLFTEEPNFKQRIFELNEKLSKIQEDDQIIEEVVKSLVLEGALIIIENRKGGFLKKAIGRFSYMPDEQIKLEEYYQSDQKQYFDIKVLPEHFPAAIYILFVNHLYTAGIFLGHRNTQVKFERDELPYVTLISSQMAQSIYSALVVKELAHEIRFLTQKAVEFQHRNRGFRGLTSSLFRNFEKERKALAREIHDGPLQLGLDLNRWLKCLAEESLFEGKGLSELKRRVSEDSGRMLSHLQELSEDLNFELRLICNNLRPPCLADLGLLPAIELLCAETMSKELIEISLDTENINREERFKEDVELAAYRFVQEGITNVVKHSGATSLKIFLKIQGEKIHLEISDPGKGFDTRMLEDWSLTGIHLGIIGMRERIKSIGGEFQIVSSDGQGVHLEASIPLIA